MHKIVVIDTNRKYGKLTPLGEEKNWQHKCKCDCGNEVWILRWHINSGASKSCGHCDDVIININKEYGKLTPLGEEKNVKRNWYHKCKCDCGNPDELWILRQHLTSGKSKSCGHCNQYKYTNYQHLSGIVSLRFTHRIGQNCRYDCLCVCGRIWNCEINSILAGRTKSCGCSRRIDYHGELYDSFPEVICHIMMQNCVEEFIFHPFGRNTNSSIDGVPVWNEKKHKIEKWEPDWKLKMWDLTFLGEYKDHYKAMKLNLWKSQQAQERYKDKVVIINRETLEELTTYKNTQLQKIYAKSGWTAVEDTLKTVFSDNRNRAKVVKYLTCQK